MTIEPIAYARNGFTDKFGIPRQAGEQSHLRTRIVFCKSYRNEDAIRGIEAFSHLWLVWGFHAVPAGGHSSLTVRPPRLGGNERVGVFATRSPFRPNPIGLTSVRLLGIERGAEGPVLVVAGADMLDGTPIYDINPYVSAYDSHPDSRNGFVDTTPKKTLEVQWAVDVPADCPVDELNEILAQDPRPAYQDAPERIYGLDYAGWNVHFRVVGDALTIENVKLMCEITKK